MKIFDTENKADRVSLHLSDKSYDKNQKMAEI
jgi:hypothetical protein